MVNLPHLSFKFAGLFVNSEDTRKDQNTAELFRGCFLNFALASGGQVRFKVDKTDQFGQLTPGRCYVIGGTILTTRSGALDFMVESIDRVTDVSSLEDSLAQYGQFTGRARLSKGSYDKDGEIRYFGELVSLGLVYSLRFDSADDFEKFPEGSFDVRGVVVPTSRVNTTTKKRSLQFDLKVVDFADNAPRVRARRPDAPAS